MSQNYLLRSAVTNAETMLLPASAASYFFRTIYISNTHSAIATISLAITSSRSFAAHGDWIIYDVSIAKSAYIVLENILVPVGHQLRGFSNTASVISLIGSGIME